MKQNRRSQQGFTLIDLSIMVTVIGILTASLLSSNKLQREITQVNEADKRLDQVEKAIKFYYSKNSYLPCPAQRTALPSSAANYLVASTCSGAIAGNIVDLLPTGGRGSVATYATKPSDVIRIGNIPTRSMGLPDSYAFDRWGNAITYVMIRQLGTSAADYTAYTTPTLTNGVINITSDGAASQVSTAADVIAYALISAGKDGMGTYSINGKATTTCNTTTAPIPLDSKNCDGDALFVEKAINETPGTSYFYDIVRWRKKANVGTWP